MGRCDSAFPYFQEAVLLAQNMHSVSPAAALGTTASAQGGMSASDCLGLPHQMVRTDRPQVAMVQADQTVRYHQAKGERAYRTEREICSAGLPHADSLHSEPVARPRARLGEAPGGRRAKGLWNSSTPNKEAINVATNQ